jgi:signal transduction histidine kinase
MVLTAAVSILLLLALSASFWLIVLTTRLGQITRELGNAIESVRLVEEMEVHLLVHSREINRSPRTPHDQDAFTAAEQALARRLVAMRDHIGTPGEAALVRRVETTLQAYLEAQHLAERSGRSTASVDAARGRLDVAVAAMEELVRVNVEQARAGRERADHWDRTANLLGLGFATSLTLGAAALLIWIWRFALRPLVGVADAIERFSAGDRSARAEVVGQGEMQEMARRFNDMAAALERERENQLLFLASVAHDLRNPLSALRTSAAVGAREDPLPPPDQIRKTLAIIGRQVRYLDRMVGDLLDAARIEAGRLDLHWERRDARLLAQETIELYASGAVQPLSLSTADEELLIRCDPVRIAQVLNNLISNAIKYSPPSGAIDVEVRRANRSVMLAVTDQGIGIAAQDAPRIFEPFWRTDQAPRVATGVGLGLSVSRRIVEAHGGRIEVESRPGRGSSFRVFLPEAPSEDPPPRAHAAGPDSRK